MLKLAGMQRQRDTCLILNEPGVGAVGVSCRNVGACSGGHASREVSKVGGKRRGVGWGGGLGLGWGGSVGGWGSARGASCGEAPGGGGGAHALPAMCGWAGNAGCGGGLAVKQWRRS